MRKWVVLLLFVMFIGILTGCASEEDVSEEGFLIYHINNAETRVESSAVELDGDSLEEKVEAIFTCLAMGDSTYKAPLGMGFSIVSWEIAGKSMTIEVSPEYSKLSGTTEVLVRAAIVRTLLQLEELEGIYFTKEGSPLTDNVGMYVGRMTKDTFIQNDGNEINTYELVKVKLYFTNENADMLVAANREKHYSTNTPLERFVVEELISGPSGQVEGIYPTINPETKIINVMTTDGICYVNLDSAFLSVINNTSLDLAANSIANSLLELNSVSKVQILVNGEVPEPFQGVLFTKE